MEYIPKSDAKLFLNDEEKATMLKASEIFQTMEDYFAEVTDNDASVRVNEWEFIPNIDCFTFTEIGDICKDFGTCGEVSVW
jgi:hypothetical protein